MATPVLALRADWPNPAALADAALELEEFARAGYVLERPVEADGLRLKPPVSRAPNMPQTLRNGFVERCPVRVPGRPEAVEESAFR